MLPSEGIIVGEVLVITVGNAVEAEIGKALVAFIVGASNGDTVSEGVGISYGAAADEVGFILGALVLVRAELGLIEAVDGRVVVGVADSSDDVEIAVGKLV